MAIFPTLYVIVSLVAIVASFFLGRELVKIKIRENANGTIYLGKNENGNDRIVFNLGMEYDDLEKYDYVVLTVIKEKGPM